MDVVFGPGQMPKVGVSLNLIEAGEIFQAKNFTVTAFAVQHRGEGCFGFTFCERSRRPFLAQRAEALGIPNGPVRRNLANGQTVTLENGRVVEPEMVLGEAQRGAKLCFVGDVSHTGALHKEVEEADLLAIEATYLEADRELARAHGHITAAAAARLARNCNVKQLVLHHVSRRYATQEILAEAQAIFPNTHVAADFDLFRVSKEKPVVVGNLRDRS
jgi:ribonuclease Z